jgi:hypothetical protein
MYAFLFGWSNNGNTSRYIFLLNAFQLKGNFSVSIYFKSGLYIENLLDNYVSGYPVLICAALESISIGMYKDTFKY